MSIVGLVLVVFLVLLLLGAIPRAGSYSADWGYAPGGFIGLILVVLVILLLMGRI